MPILIPLLSLPTRTQLSYLTFNASVADLATVNPGNVIYCEHRETMENL